MIERKSYESKGVPIFGRDYYSLPHGPITSECLDLINQKGCNRKPCEWDRVVHPQNQHHVELIHTPEYEELKAGRKPITLKKIADAVGVDPNLIKEEAQTARFLANAFALTRYVN